MALGTATSYAVLAGSTITNTGAGVINGDLGLSPGTSVTGFPPGHVNGVQHVADAAAVQAKSDLTTAYNDAVGRTPTTNLTSPGNIGGTTLTPGVHKAASSLNITGTVTLDAQGDPNAVFVFQIGSTLITAPGSHVSLAGGAQACNVFWQVGSSATIDTTSVFKGNVLALTAITVNTNAVIEGRVLAQNAAVTLDTNTITTANCTGPQLSITTPAAGHLGSGAPDGTITGQLGPVTVDASGVDSWTVTVSVTNCTTGGGSPAETIPKSRLAYWSGPATAKTGTGTATPGQAIAAQAQSLSTPRTAFSLQSGTAVTSVTWTPTLIVSVPAFAVAGSYTTTVTHSVA
ncbi:ice-binding family protein [Streptomyces sp. NPDC060064]|uniref:ice-binding family protein n=1 Tax=Streptomyces sp. NPDC060064 TaxID=3347049 RepID=UPI0036786189